MAEPDPSSQLAFELASTQLQEQLNGADSDDVKALGYLGVDVGGAAAIFAAHASLNGAWPYCLAGFIAASVLLMLALRSRTFATGPRPIEVYFDGSATPYLDAIQALEKAGSAVRTLRQGTRRRLFRFSILVTIFTTALSLFALRVH